MPPELVGDGVLIVGDAAGMCMNLGFTIRGMDLADCRRGSSSKTVLSAMKATISVSKNSRNIVSILRVARCAICACTMKLPAFDNPRMFNGYLELAVCGA